MRDPDLPGLGAVEQTLSIFWNEVCLPALAVATLITVVYAVTRSQIAAGTTAVVALAVVFLRM